MYAQGSDALEKKEVRIGFILLTDCASIVIASVLGIDKKYGVTIVSRKEASWASIRNKMVTGENDMTHMLLGQTYGVHLDAGGAKKDMAVLMTLNHNGHAITLSKKLAEKGEVDSPPCIKLMATEKRPADLPFTFAQTFPTGTHARCLYYGPAANGVNPVKDAKVITVPPPQNGRQHAGGKYGRLFCGGEPLRQPFWRQASGLIPA